MIMKKIKFRKEKVIAKYKNFDDNATEDKASQFLNEKCNFEETNELIKLLDLKGEDINMEDKVVSVCPLRGHSPLCSIEECSKQVLDGYKECKKILGIKE